MPIQSQYVSNTRPPWLEALERSIGEASQAQRQEGYHAYPGRRLEGLQNPDLQQAWQMGRQTEDYAPYLQRAHDYTAEGNKRFPEMREQYMEPYNQEVLDAVRRESGRSFTEELLPALNREFIGAGQYGSTLNQQRQNQLVRVQQQNLQDQVAKYRGEALAHAGKMHSVDKGGFLEAAGQQPALAQTKQAGRIGDIAALTEQGAAQRGHGQAQKDIDYQDFMRQRAAPFEALSHQAGIVQGLPGAQTQYAVQQTPGIPQLNTTGQMGALAGNLLGARMAGGYGRKKGGAVRKYQEGGEVDTNPNLQPSAMWGMQRGLRNPYPADHPMAAIERQERRRAFSPMNRLNEFGDSHTYNQQPFHGVPPEMMQQYNQENLYSPEVRETMPWNNPNQNVQNAANPQEGQANYKKGGKSKKGLSRLPLNETSFAKKPKPGGSLGIRRMKNKTMGMK